MDIYLKSYILSIFCMCFQVNFKEQINTQTKVIKANVKYLKE